MNKCSKILMVLFGLTFFTYLIGEAEEHSVKKSLEESLLIDFNRETTSWSTLTEQLSPATFAAKDWNDLEHHPGKKLILLTESLKSGYSAHKKAFYIHLSVGGGSIPQLATYSRGPPAC
ncbi:hypothetical protein [Echinicola pacifica]|nr:hypothetical protein [Echinicola pacifica]